MTLLELEALESKPISYAIAAKAMLDEPGCTLSYLAFGLDRNPFWLTERLALLKLDASIQPLVESGQMNLSNAYALAKCPIAKQLLLLDKALTSEPQYFIPACY